MGQLSPKKSLYLLRHGNTGLSGKFIGSSDVSTNEVGREEISRAATKLNRVDFQRVICSPMLRCRQAVEKLTLPCTVEYNDWLKEIDFGRWEKKSFHELDQQDQGLVDLWVSDYPGFCFPGGESIQQFLERLTCLLDFLQNTREERLLLVTHGGVIKHLLCMLLGLPVDRYLSFDVRTGRYCSLDLFSNGGVLTGFNL